MAVFQTEFGQKSDAYQKLNPTASAEDVAAAVRGGWNVPAPAAPTYGVPQPIAVPAPSDYKPLTPMLGGMPPTPTSSVPAPQTFANGSPPSNGIPSFTFNPTTPAPQAPPTSGYKPITPNLGMSAPSSPVPAPVTNSTGGVSGTITPAQRQIYDSLPPEDRARFLSSLGGMPSTPSMGVPPHANQSVPAPANLYPTITPEQIKAEVAAKIAAETQRRITAAGQAKSGMQTSYDRLRATENDTRTLQNLQNDRSLSPFSGRSDFAKGMIGRERAISDRQESENLSTRLANIDVTLQDYMNSTPEQQRAMENELTRQERDYSLKVDQTNYQRQRDSSQDTLNAAKTNYDHGQDTITNNRNAANDALALRKQHIDEANYYSDKYGITVEPKDSFQEVINQVKGLPTAAQQTAAQKAEDTKRSEAWKRVDQLGSVQSQADADLLGVPVGTQTAAAKQQAVDNAYKTRTADISQQNANTAAGKAQEEANKPKPVDKNQFEAEAVTNLDKMTPTMRKKALADEKESIIKQLGLSGYTTLYNKYFDEYGDPK